MGTQLVSEEILDAVENPYTHTCLNWVQNLKDLESLETRKSKAMILP